MEEIRELYYGDNLDVLRRYIKDESIDLCYIDPPFNSKRNYNQIYNNIGNEDKAQSQAFVDTWTWNLLSEIGLEEIFSGKNKLLTPQCVQLIDGLLKILGKSSLLAYLISMTLRIAEIHRVLKSTGSFYLHCDPTASHYLKLVLDGIFCSQEWEFRNEIIWSNESSSGFKTQTKHKFIRGHDVIFFYSNKNSKFRHQYLHLSNSTLKRYDKEDEEGRKHKIYYEDGSERRQYLEKSHGRKLSDTWTDLPSFQTVNASGEHLGYPTQKPESLLERIIQASSDEGDLVLDAYCGCGTTVAVAERLKRNWIGVDITYQSISLILRRLEEHFGKELIDKINLNGLPRDFESAEALAHKKDDRLRKEFEKWAILTYSNNRAMINEKKGGDGGIDGIAYINDINGNNRNEFKKILFSVKSNKVLSPSVVRDLNGAMERENAVMGYLITLYPMENLIKESKKFGLYKSNMNNIEFNKIEVISIDDIIKGKRMSVPASLSIEVLKKAERKSKNIQEELDL
jgi:DNA modification methylase